MELYLVSFYDNNESGNVEHNEMYTTYAAAERRFNTLKNKLNGYSWVYLFDTIAKFGRSGLTSVLTSAAPAMARMATIMATTVISK